MDIDQAGGFHPGLEPVHNAGPLHGGEVNWSLRVRQSVQGGLAALYTAAFPEQVEALIMIDMAGCPPR